jgi:protein CMS1
VCMGVVTPNRVHKLVEASALGLERVRLVVVLDMQRDVKQRTVLDIPEVRADLWSLYDSHLDQRLTKGSTKLCLVH